MSYGYTLKDRIISSIKRFFLKFFIITFVVVGGTIYFFKSDFGNSISLIQDFKSQTNSELAQIYETQTTEFSNAVRKDLGLQPVAVKKDNTIIKNPIEETITKTTENKTPSNNENTVNKEKPLEKSGDLINNSGFTTYTIGFYYDHSNAPRGVTKEEALNILTQASQQWFEACGVTFEYKGDKLADYVNNKNLISGKVGIIKWATQMEGSAIGEAHVGNYMGPAPGFVLALFSDFFVNNKADLINTVTHEMGHVIGLEHSANKNSIMFNTESRNAKLQESDKAMCRYFRYRWSGMNKNQAQDKAGIISNTD